MKVDRATIAEVLRLKSEMRYSYTRIHEELGIPTSTVQNICENAANKIRHPRTRSPANIAKIDAAMAQKSPRPPLRPAVTDPSLLKKITAGR